MGWGPVKRCSRGAVPFDGRNRLAIDPLRRQLLSRRQAVTKSEAAEFFEGT